jgi:hypothetical protein
MVIFLCLPGCGDSSTKGENGPSGSTCDPVAFTMLNTAGSNAKVCSATTRCIAEKCPDKAEKCAGPDYASGVFAGLCGPYFDCVKVCECNKTCVDACDPGTTDCAACLYDLGIGCTLTCAMEVASCGKQ